MFLPDLKEPSDDIGEANGSRASSAGQSSLGFEAGALSIGALPMLASSPPRHITPLFFTSLQSLTDESKWVR